MGAQTTRETQGVGVANPWPTFVICAMAQYIVMLDMSAVTVAFADIEREFISTERSTIAWVVTAYSILFGSLLAVSGRIADRVGRRRVFLAGATVFLAGSLLSTLSPNLAVLIAGRGLQGMGAALITPASIGLLLATFPSERRSQIISWSGGIGALGVASGPALGALLITGFGWRAAFWLNIGVCVMALVLGRRVLRETAADDSSRPDVPGAVILTVAVAACVLALTQIRTWGLSDGRLITAIVVAVISAVVVIRRSRTHPDPMLPPELFRERVFSAANGGSFLFGIAFAAMSLNNVLFLRNIWEYSVLRAGLFSVLAPTMVAVVSMFVSRLITRFGFRTMLIFGPLGFAAMEITYALVLTATPQPFAVWVPLSFLLGSAIGMVAAVLPAAAVSRLPPTRFALGGALSNTSRQIGTAIGVPLVVTVQTMSGGLQGYRNGWLLAAAAGIAASLVSLLQPRRDQPRRDQPRVDQPRVDR
jgi:EmrB/QacA subfamily drug resistance transporter